MAYIRTRTCTLLSVFRNCVKKKKKVGFWSARKKFPLLPTLILLGKDSRLCGRRSHKRERNKDIHNVRYPLFRQRIQFRRTRFSIEAIDYRALWSTNERAPVADWGKRDESVHDGVNLTSDKKGHPRDCRGVIARVVTAPRMRRICISMFKIHRENIFTPTQWNYQKRIRLLMAVIIICFIEKKMRNLYS